MKRFWMGLLTVVLSTGMLRAAEPACSGAEPVRNVILLIGDGMGLAQVSLLQIEQQYAPTAFDRAEGVALITTRSANNRVTDSAAAGTALATGHKTDNGMLGQTPDGEPVQSMIARAHAEGRPTGLAVCCYLQHATPAAFYAHVADRGDNPAITRDLAASGIDVLFGGGRKWLDEASPAGVSWLETMRRDGYAVAGTMAEADTVRTLPLLAVVAEESVLDDDMEAGYLTRATRKSLELLSAEAERRDKGFVLMVEGSFIDWACHGNDADELLFLMRDFDSTVAAAMDFADRTPGTLVVVTADHETGGLTIPSNEADFTRSESGLNYSFSTTGHTGTMVPVYLYGAGADRITGVMDNTQLSQRIMQLLGLE